MEVSLRQPAMSLFFFFFSLCSSNFFERSKLCPLSQRRRSTAQTPKNPRKRAKVLLRLVVSPKSPFQEKSLSENETLLSVPTERKKNTVVAHIRASQPSAKNSRVVFTCTYTMLMRLPTREKRSPCVIREPCKSVILALCAVFHNK